MLTNFTLYYLYIKDTEGMRRMSFRESKVSYTVSRVITIYIIIYVIYFLYIKFFANKLYSLLIIYKGFGGDLSNDLASKAALKRARKQGQNIVSENLNQAPSEKPYKCIFCGYCCDANPQNNHRCSRFKNKVMRIPSEWLNGLSEEDVTKLRNAYMKKNGH